MTERVLVPFELSDPPASLEVTVYDGDGEAPAGDLSDVTLYVAPYGRDALSLIDRLPALRAVQVLSAGYENALPHLREGIALHNGRGLHDASTAEHALALILAAQRELPRWSADQAAHRWEPGFTRSLADEPVLVVGAGSIGTAITRRLEPFEVPVTRVAHHARPAEGVHGIDELHALLPAAKIVVLVLPHTPDTVGLFGAAEFALLPDDALVVNVGRGTALELDALLAENGRVRAALDVTEPEPLPADHALWDAPGVILTPHVAGGSASFRPRAQRFVEAQVQRWADGLPLLNKVES